MNPPPNPPDEFSPLLHAAHPSPQPAPDYAESLLADALSAFDALPQTPPPASLLTRRWLRLSLAAAACLAVAIATLALLTRSHMPPRPDERLAATAPHNTSASAHAEPVGGVVDLWLADKRPQVVQCRQAWQTARDEDAKFEPPPPGITPDHQRSIVVAAYEKAIAMIPDAPPVPDGLLRIAHLWMGSGIEPEHPRKALDAYERVLHDFPGSRYALSALCGKAAAYWELGDAASSRTAWQQVLAFPLPANADPALVRQLGEAKPFATKMLASLEQQGRTFVHTPSDSPPGRLPAMTLGLLTDDQLVSRASLIVRARVTGWADGIINYHVARVIYGNLADQALRVNYSGVLKALTKSLRDDAEKELGPEPTPAQMEAYVLRHSGITQGADMILYLYPRPTPPGQPPLYLQSAAAYDAPPQHRLDDLEATIIRIIAEGTYLAPSFPQPADILEEHVRAADLIVRAQLVQVTDTDSRWTITDAIKGHPQKKTLLVPHDLFRLRAEAIIRHQTATTQPATQWGSQPTTEWATQPGTHPATPPTLQQQIAAEMKRLIQAELLPNQKAILFLNRPQADGDAIRATLRQRIYEDASGKRLDAAEQTLRAAQEHKLPTDF